jgi:hypothetical protein
MSPRASLQLSRELFEALKLIFFWGPVSQFNPVESKSDEDPTATNI